MLRDPDQPETSWEDDEKELGDNPERPFYAPGETLGKQRAFARQRCAQFDMEYEEHPDMTGGKYFNCTQRKTK